MTPAAAAYAAAASAIHPLAVCLCSGAVTSAAPAFGISAATLGNEVIVLSADGPQAAALVKGISNASAIAFDVSDTEKLSHYIKGSDIVVSLLPGNNARSRCRRLRS